MRLLNMKLYRMTTAAKKTWLYLNPRWIFLISGGSQSRHLFPRNYNHLLSPTAAVHKHLKQRNFNQNWCILFSWLEYVKCVIFKEKVSRHWKYICFKSSKKCQMSSNGNCHQISIVICSGPRIEISQQVSSQSLSTNPNVINLTFLSSLSISKWSISTTVLHSSQMILFSKNVLRFRLLRRNYQHCYII